MKKSIVTYKAFIEKFPSVKPKSKELAKKLLPLYPTPELAQIAGALMTDGHIDWYSSDGRPRTRKIILYSSNREECEWFLNLIKNIFSINGKVIAYIPKYGNYKLQPYKAVVWNSVIARILILAGVPAGDKTKLNYSVPRWIKGGNIQINKNF